jgi:hypothetical protein
LCARTLDAVLARPGLASPSLETRSQFTGKVELSLTGDVQRRLSCLKSIALTAVMPTSIRMAASKTKTIKEVLLVLPNEVHVGRQILNTFTYQWFAIALPLREVTKPGHELTQISCIHCTGTGSRPALSPFQVHWLGLAEPD